jgi:hypothetical protein
LTRFVISRYVSIVLRREVSGGALIAVLWCGCASVGDNNPIGGGKDMSVVAPMEDLAGVDLTGVVPDLAGADFSGNDLLPCNPITQAGCVAGEKCTLRQQKGQCVTDGDKVTGALCGTGGTDDCKRENLCIIEQTTPTRLEQCRQFCLMDSDCKAAPPIAPANIARCLYTLNMVTEKICTVPCNPVTELGGSGCATGLGCQTFAFTITGTTTVAQGTDCVVLGAGVNNTLCPNGNDDCSHGFACVDNGTDKRCRKQCRIGTGTQHCAGIAGATCTAPSNIQNATFGFCL